MLVPPARRRFVALACMCAVLATWEGDDSTDSEPAAGGPGEIPVIVCPCDGIPLELPAPGPRVSAATRGASTVPVTFDVTDENGNPTHFSLLIRDRSTLAVHPPLDPDVRQEPDLWFEQQIYRATGDRELLPPGVWLVDVGRGPEYLTQRVVLDLRSGAPATVTRTLARWVHPEARGWVSGDHHIHAAGCAFTPQTSVGFRPESLIPRVAGESLGVAQVLTWQPSFEVQAQYFGAEPHASSTDNHLLKYDVEVAAFGSHRQGHYCLLGLSDMHYPGTGTGWRGWPTWGVPILQWVRSQGGVTGTAHSGVGLEVQTEELPNYVVPPMNGIGAMEFFLDITMGLIDFMSTVDTDCTDELNAWYHVRNCGFPVEIAGESDFPCFGKAGIGLGRSYVRLDRSPGEPLQYDEWLAGLRDGKSYVTEGGSHLFDFRVAGLDVGDGDVLLPGPGQVRVTGTATALLTPAPRPPRTWRGWDIEQARLPDRQVAVEIVVNGLPVHRQPILADGSDATIDVTIPINKSSWVAMRIRGSSHTNAVDVLVGGRPVRASRDSATWCLAALDSYWQQKRKAISPQEITAASQAYRNARAVYEAIAAESSVGPFANAEPYGVPCPSPTAEPRIGAAGRPLLGSPTFAITLTDAPPNVPAIPLVGGSRARTAVGACELLVGAPLYAIPGGPVTDPTGSARLPLGIPADPALHGLELYFQWLVAVPAAARPWTLSDALDVHFASS